MGMMPRTGSSVFRVMLAALAFALVATAGAGCNPNTGAYGPSKIELESPTAKVDTTRHTDPVAVSDATRAASH